MENLDYLISLIISKAVRAPSGDNSQPWKIIKISSSRIKIYHAPDKDHKILNVGGYGSIIAIGALVENIYLLAKENSIFCEINFCEDASVLIYFTYKQEANDSTEKWSDLISRRATLRTEFKREKISENDKADIISHSLPHGIKLNWVDNPNDIKKIADIASVTEKIVLNNETLHELFFSIVDFSNKKDSGIQLKAMGLPKPAEIIFRILRIKSINNFLKKIRIQEKIAHQNSIMYSKSDAMLVFSIDVESQQSYFNFGRYLQHIWLIATEHSIALHPITGIIYLYKYIKSKDFDKVVINKNEEDLITRSYISLQNIINNEQKLIFLARIGYVDSELLIPLTNRRNITI